MPSHIHLIGSGPLAVVLCQTLLAQGKKAMLGNPIDLSGPRLRGVGR
jgi:hypothetical protein